MDDFLVIQQSDLGKKEAQAIKLLQSYQRGIGEDVQIELAYSGGKDSDVILHLARLAGINIRPIYKNTTIDPSGTIAHCKANGVEIIHPKKTFFQLVGEKGFPTRRGRFCCSCLKEYKILDHVIIGVRRAESQKRTSLYKEPVLCRHFSKNKKVSIVLPILEWSDADVAEYINANGIQCHPLYYDEQGRFHVERRLGCQGCPLASKNKRVEFFKRNPKWLKAWLRAGERHYSQPKFQKKFSDGYEAFYYILFGGRLDVFNESKRSLFDEDLDFKKILEEIFNTKL